MIQERRDRPVLSNRLRTGVDRRVVVVGIGAEATRANAIFIAVLIDAGKGGGAQAIDAGHACGRRWIVRNGDGYRGGGRPVAGGVQRDGAMRGSRSKPRAYSRRSYR